MKEERRKFYKLLWAICLPLALQQLFTSLINILDTFMLGGLSEEVITAAGLAGKLFFLFIIITYGISSGAAIFMAQFWGKKDINSIHKIMGICLVFGISASVIFAVIALAMPAAVMTIFSKDPAVIAYGADYLRIISVSYIFTAVAQCFYAALRSVNKTLIPALFTVVALVMNASFNALFIFGLGMGIKGAAAATVIARAVECVCLVITLKATKNLIWARLREYFSFTKEHIKKYLKVAGLVVLTEFEWALGTTLYTVAYRRYGTPYQTALQISENIVFLLNVFSMAFGTSASIIIGNKIGAGETELAKRYSKRFVGLSLSAGVIILGALAVLSPFAPLLFNISAEVTGFTTVCMLIMAVSAPMRCLEFMLMVGILRSGGDTLFCAICDFVGVWLISLPLLLIAAYVLHLSFFVVYALSAAELVFKLTAGLIRLRRGKWVRNVTVSPEASSLSG